MIFRVMEKMIEHFGNDIRRINHSLKVCNFADIIGNSLIPDDRVKAIIEYTALLHDIGIKEAERKYNSSSGNYQEIEGPPIARKILSELCVPEDMVNRICFIIGNHHSYTTIDGVDFQIIVEADFLVNIFEDDMSKNAIESIYERIFKTEKGKQLFMMMYMNS